MKVAEAVQITDRRGSWRGSPEWQALLAKEREKTRDVRWDESLETSIADPALRAEVEALDRADELELGLSAARGMARGENADARDLVDEQRAASDEMAARFRWDRQQELAPEREAARRGRVFHACEFFPRLERAVGKELAYSKGQGELLGKICGIKVRTRQPSLVAIAGEEDEFKYATWAQIPLMQEFSVMHFDAHDVPLNEKFRGWRTVLLAMIEKGFLTERAMVQEFGAAEGMESRRVNGELYALRNG